MTPTLSSSPYHIVHVDGYAIILYTNGDIGIADYAKDAFYKERRLVDALVKFEDVSGKNGSTILTALANIIGNSNSYHRSLQRQRKTDRIRGGYQRIASMAITGTL